MERLKQAFFHSLMSYINLSLLAIISLSLLSIFFAFWATEQTEHDAQSINVAGTIRYQTLQLGLMAKTHNRNLEQGIAKLDQTWENPLFTNIREHKNSSQLQTTYVNAYHNWLSLVRPVLIQHNQNKQLYPILMRQVMLTDKLVDQIQINAEKKISHLRNFLLISLLITTLVGSFIFYLLKNRIEEPLNQLTEAAHKIGEGEINQIIHIDGKDELSLLATTFNYMSQSIKETYNELEARVFDRTKELERNNKTLELLFDTARMTLDDDHPELDYQHILDGLSSIVGNDNIELCLFTSQGKLPYLQVAPEQFAHDNCTQKNCDDCQGAAPFEAVNIIGFCQKFPIMREDIQYGVINVRNEKVSPVEDWKMQLFRSVADQLAIALSLSEKKDQEHRLAMLNERTVIARELHDSLAQSLSYLKIQVTRLQKCHDKEKFELQPPIIEELREGLSSAYRHLRELLTTFRLKIDQGGIASALQQTLEQLTERSPMKVSLDNQLNNIPLAPMEEIHLMQITREASQNAVNHSKGEQLKIKLVQQMNKNIELTIEDDGIGLPDQPEKLNHYGLAIMEERSKHIAGKLRIESSNKGTKVSLVFTPQYALEHVKPEHLTLDMEKSPRVAG